MTHPIESTTAGTARGIAAFMDTCCQLKSEGVANEDITVALTHALAAAIASFPAETPFEQDLRKVALQQIAQKLDTLSADYRLRHAVKPKGAC